MFISHLPEIKLLEIFNYIFKNKTLYILGAGASATYIKPNYDLNNDARDFVSKLSGFDSHDLKPMSEANLTNEQSQRYKILGGKSIIGKHHDGQLIINNKMDIYDSIIYSNPRIFEFICALSYTLNEMPHLCPEYSIFNFVNGSSQVINFNHDNLAEHFIKKLYIHSLHGTLTPNQKRVMQKYIIPSIYRNDLSKELFKNLYFATQENEHLLLGSKKYTKLQQELISNRFNYIVIIGYSFFKKNDCDIYDNVFYDLLRSYLIDNTPKVIIIDPNPEFTLEILVRSLTAIEIECFSIFWNNFTYALYYFHQLKCFSAPIFSMTNLKRFSQLYQYFNSVESYNLCDINLKKIYDELD
ncbi:hypothetical protein L3V82_11585 [Thiotrichales bacterium 19S3-7]|nr:hypothetical protein [Thiotrichales bacterium 19S3-7]MCF6802855.1 hypothetical protein [Thiotrichales bacterium 19S3-11]